MKVSCTHWQDDKGGEKGEDGNVQQSVPPDNAPPHRTLLVAEYRTVNL